MATIQASDVLPVRSRVSWGAVLAGAVVALTVYMVLMLGGMALGVTVSDRVSDKNLAIGAGVWSLVSMLLSLFAGGYVSTRCSVGENKTEAAIYGIVVWGVVFVMLTALTVGTVNTGMSALMGAARTAVAANGGSARLSDADLQKAGFTQDEITKFKEKFGNLRDTAANAGEKVREAAEDPHTKAAAWWAFTGIVLSLASAVLGALMGAGPTLVITSFRIRAAAPVVANAPVSETTVR